MAERELSAAISPSAEAHEASALVAAEPVGDKSAAQSARERLIGFRLAADPARKCHRPMLTVPRSRCDGAPP